VKVLLISGVVVTVNVTEKQSAPPRVEFQEGLDTCRGCLYTRHILVIDSLEQATLRTHGKSNLGSSGDVNVPLIRKCGPVGIVPQQQ
jgi:hypothetical protein